MKKLYTLGVFAICLVMIISACGIEETQIAPPDDDDQISNTNHNDELAAEQPPNEDLSNESPADENPPAEEPQGENPPQDGLPQDEEPPPDGLPRDEEPPPDRLPNDSLIEENSTFAPFPFEFMAVDLFGNTVTDETIGEKQMFFIHFWATW